MMWMACAAVISACSPSPAAAISACSPSPAAEPAVLPPEEQVRTVSVERDGVAADCGNREQIGELLSILADMEPTNLQSVQDVPQADAYTSIHFEDTEGRVYTIFYYETEGTDYVEQSYQGIYKPAPALGELLDSWVYFAGRWHDKSGLSEDTLRWLAWYNGLSEEEQACVSAVPADLLDESGIFRTEETDAQAD